MAIQISVEVDSSTLKKLVLQYLSSILNYDLKSNDITIQVKSKHNYKAEWEEGDFRARVSKHDID